MIELPKHISWKIGKSVPNSEITPCNMVLIVLYTHRMDGPLRAEVFDARCVEDHDGHDLWVWESRGDGYLHLDLNILAWSLIEEEEGTITPADRLSMLGIKSE